MIKNEIKLQKIISFSISLIFYTYSWQSIFNFQNIFKKRLLLLLHRIYYYYTELYLYIHDNI